MGGCCDGPGCGRSGSPQAAGTDERLSSPLPSSFRPWCRTPWLPDACARRAPCLCLLRLLPRMEGGRAGPRTPPAGPGAAPACGRAAPAAAAVSSRFLNGLVCCNRLLPSFLPSCRPAAAAAPRGTAGGARREGAGPLPWPLPWERQTVGAAPAVRAGPGWARRGRGVPGVSERGWGASGCGTQRGSCGGAAGRGSGC